MVFGTIVSIEDLIVTLTGLNSAWTCVDDKDKDKIWLGGATQMASAQNSIDVALNGAKPHLRIALMHHPRNWIHPSESQILRGRTQNDYDILLHGHAHDQWVDEIPSPQHVVIAAGAGTAESSEEFGYNIVELHPHEARVLLRTYDQKGSGWIAQNIAHRADDGCWVVKLPLGLTPKIPSAKPPDIERSTDELVETPNARGRYGLDSTLLKLTEQLRQKPIMVVYGLAGVGKSVAIDELKRLPTWRGLQAISLTARTDSGPNDLFSELAPFLGNHEERPEARRASR